MVVPVFGSRKVRRLEPDAASGTAPPALETADAESVKIIFGGIRRLAMSSLTMARILVIVVPLCRVS